MSYPLRWYRRFDLSFGILLNLGLATLALQLYQVSFLSLLSPLIVAIALGILLRNSIGVSPIFHAGTRFCLKRILKLAIVLMGLRLSLAELQTVGITGLVLVSITLLSTFSFTIWLGRSLHINQRLVWLIAAGTSICGASAVVATNAVIEGSDEDMVYAVTLVTALGTAAMLLYPLLATPLQLSPEAFGLWCGTSIHEVAQVVAAAFQNSPVSGEFATISKLSRVLFLLPVMVILGSFSAASQGNTRRMSKLPIPWFVLLFVLLVMLNSLSLFSEDFKAIVLQLNQVLLAISLTAMGLETDLTKLKQTGFKPFYLAALSWLFLSGLSLGLIKIFFPG